MRQSSPLPVVQRGKVSGSKLHCRGSVRNVSVGAPPSLPTHAAIDLLITIFAFPGVSVAPGSLNALWCQMNDMCRWVRLLPGAPTIRPS
ncbi:hypothetical protein D3C87_1882360 [compost metagenome]